jgi:phenylacetate-CoA ligase
MPATTDSQALVAWLRRIQPQYLLIYPSIWRAVLDQLQDAQGLEQLVQVRTIGETLSDDLRRRTHALLGVPMADIYSSEELGVIAIQCPHSGLYHTMAEGLIVEVLATDNQACKVGEIGRVVVTDLLNFASPMLRYEVGDYAEVGPVCGCGRGLPTLKRVLGRERNMVKLPDGCTHWPLTGFHDFDSVANISQYQLVQKSLELIEVRLVIVGAPLTDENEQALSTIISKWMKHQFQYQFVYYLGRIPKAASDKFEEFLCEI